MANNNLHIEDEALIKQFCQEGNKSAFGDLFSRYQHLAIAISYKYLQDKESARDNALKIFGKLLTTICTYDIKLFRAWIHVVVKNNCLMQLRKKNINLNFTDNIDAYDMESDDSMHLALKKDEQLNTMHTYLQQLEEKQRVCLSLFYLQEKSYAFIEEHTGYSYMEVKSAIQNGKRNLKILMQKNG